MKCIQCKTDNNLKDRQSNQGRCKNCNHPFAFEPTTMGKFKFTDPFFDKAIKDISANKTLFFTPKQFLYLLDRRLKSKAFVNPAGVGCFLLIVGFIFGFTFLQEIEAINTFWFVFVVWMIAYTIYLFYISNISQASLKIRRQCANTLQILGAITSILALTMLFSSGSALYVILAPMGLIAVWIGLIQKRRLAKSTETFFVSATKMEKWLNQWRRANGRVGFMLNSPQSCFPASTQSSNLNPDVTAYSFDRLVVCDRDEIANMLIANNFHFENNCAVLSINRYPQNIFNTILEMLDRNPDLKVFALHNCDPKGMEIVSELRTNPDWFANRNIVIIDVGLLPRQIMASTKNMFVQNSKTLASQAQSLAPHIRQKLSPEELKWLDAGNFVELESFTPKKLIHILQHSMVVSQEITLESLEEERTNTNLLVLEEAEDSGYSMENFG